MAENNLMHSGTTNRSSNSDWDENQSRYNRDQEDNRQRSNFGQSGVNRESDFDENPGNRNYGSDWGNSNYNRGTQQGNYNRGGYGYQGNNQNFGYNQPNYGQTGYGSSGYGNQGWGEGYENDFNRGNYRNRDFENDYSRTAGRNYGNQPRYGNTFHPSQEGSDFNRGNYGQSNRRSYLGGSNPGFGSDFDRGDYGRYSSGYGFNSPYYDTHSSERDYYPERTSFRNRPRYGNEGYMGANYDRRYESDYGNRNRYDNDRNWWDRTADEVSSWFGDEEAERRRQMDKQRDHRGRGPRGYQRSDERIKEDINDRLSDDSFVDATEVNVDVSRGEVVLSGAVDSRIAKRRAEDLAEAISGVRNVENRLRVTDTSSYIDNPRSTSSTPSGTTATNTSSSATDRSKRS